MKHDVLDNTFLMSELI